MARSHSQGGSQIRQLLEAVHVWDHTEVERCYSDSIGIFCMKLQTPRGCVFATAKRYQYRGYASFPRKVVRRAHDEDVPIAVFFDQVVGEGYVFNPAVVLSEGIENRANTDRPGRSVWLDISVSDGVVYGDYITDRSDLPEGTFTIPDQRSLRD